MSEDHIPVPTPDNQSSTPPPEFSETFSEMPAPPVQPRVRIQLPQPKAVVTYSLMGISLLIFIGQMLGELFLGGDLLAALGMKVNFYIEHGQLWRLVTAGFLHGDIIHIAFNMYALHLIGRELERFYGSARFLILYLVGAFAGNVFSYLFNDANSYGASTAIFALVGSYAVFVYRNRTVFGANTQRVLRNIGQVLVINLIIGLSPGIDNWGHLGGLFGGAALSWIGGIEYAVLGDNLKGFQLKEKNTPQQFVLAAAAVLIFFGGLVVANVLFF